jgi:ubiquitin-conjugating enzyme E2 I
LSEERKALRKDRPFGFYAKPTVNADNSINLFRWECGVPGPLGTDWEGGVYKLTMVFTDEVLFAKTDCGFTVFAPASVQEALILVKCRCAKC